MAKLFEAIDDRLAEFINRQKVFFVATAIMRAGFRRVGIGIAFGTFVGHGGAAVVTADFAGQ